MFDRDPKTPDRFEAPRPADPGARPTYPWTPVGAPAAGLPGAVRVDPSLGTQARAGVREGYLTMSFVWMFLALLVSAGAAAFVLASPATLDLVARNFFILIIAELALVFVVSLGINRLGAIPALGLLFVYALLNGATISAIVAFYVATGGVNGVLTAFLGASSIFGAAALYGVVTKRDLTSLGGILFVGLIGLVVASVVHVFIGGSTLNLIIGIVGVLIFTALTAYDVQRLQRGDMRGINTREGASVIGALALYLNFVNLFLMLLRIFGGNRD